jgi:seryl-tRNA synthetase
MAPGAPGRIIVRMGEAALLQRLQALVDAPPGDAAQSLAYLEDSLTDGYARALALEAERARVSRTIGMLAADDGDDAEQKTRELSSLSQRLARAETELATLRDTLNQLRGRAMQLRAAVAS